MPLPARSNTDASNRYVEGRKLQDKYFGSEMAVIRGSTLQQMMKENSQNERVIALLKCYIERCAFGAECNFDTYVTSQCTDEEQDLLKEVLKDE